MVRLQKFLADAGIASRRKAETLIADGKVKINGAVVTKPGTLVDEHQDTVECNGVSVTLKTKKVYLAVHKPVGYISSASDGQGKSILSIIGSKERIYPVGRLDRDSCGLLILTNDGEFTNRITHARFGCEKEYFVTLDQDLAAGDIKKMERGMRLADGTKLRGVKVMMAKNKSARLALKEGVNRQIRRMLGTLGYTVVKLKRIRIGKLELGSLKAGEWKSIRPEDVL